MIRLNVDDIEELGWPPRIVEALRVRGYIRQTDYVDA